MKKYLAFSFVLASLLISTNIVSAATIFNDDFGTGSTSSTVSGWTEGSDGAERRGFSGSGNDTASPNGGRFALMQGDDGWICKLINASGYNNLLLSYYWRGDDEANNPSDDGLVEYKSSGNCNDSNNTWTNLKNHDMQSDSSWTQQSPFSLPNTLNNSSFLIRFHTDTNSSSEDFRIDGVLLTGTAVDSTAPVITRLGISPVTVEGGSTYTDAGATATDNIDGNITASIVTVNPVNTAVVGTYTVTYNVSDAAGNNATQVTRTVNVVDTTKPTITLLGSSDVTIQAGSTYTDAGSNVTDNVDTSLTATVTGSVNTAALGDYTLSFNVTDSNGNVADTVTRTVHVVDTTAPVITLTGGNMSIHTGDTFSEPGADATDNLDGSISVTITGGPVVTTTPATFTLHYNAVDSQGNNAIEKTRTVTVVDVSVPVITLIGAGSVDVPVFSTYTDAGATATDDVDGNLTSSIIVGGDTVNTSVLGDYTITYNVSDSSLNAATQITRTVHVVDTIAPTITLNGDNPMHLKKGDVYVEPGATATDNYDAGSITVVIDGTVNTAVPATYTINYSATDSTEHTTSTSRSVIVRNLGTNSTLSSLIPSAGTLSPEFNSETTSYTVILPFGTTTIPTVSATTTDEFATKEITQPLSVTGTATVVVSSEDTSEDTGTHTTYTVVFSVAENPDTTAPVITISGSNPISVNVGDTYTDAGATATDDIDGNITESIIVVNNVNTAVAGTYTVTYNVSDSAGNHATEATRTVNVGSSRRGSSGRLPGNFAGGQVLGAEKFIFTEYMKLGSRGGEVPELQKFLNKNGYTCGPVDGIFGPLTDACVRAFQKANPPLRVDGIVGPLTRAVLNK